MALKGGAASIGRTEPELLTDVPEADAVLVPGPVEIGVSVHPPLEHL